MKLPMIRLGETLDTLEMLKGDVGVTPILQFSLQKIYTVLRQSGDIASPLLTGEWEDDKWLEAAYSLEFEGLTVSQLESLPDLSPKTMRVLLRITTS